MAIVVVGMRILALPRLWPAMTKHADRSNDWPNGWKFQNHSHNPDGVAEGVIGDTAITKRLPA